MFHLFPLLYWELGFSMDLEGDPCIPITAEQVKGIGVDDRDF